MQEGIITTLSSTFTILYEKFKINDSFGKTKEQYNEADSTLQNSKMNHFILIWTQKQIFKSRKRAWSV